MWYRRRKDGHEVTVKHKEPRSLCYRSRRPGSVHTFRAGDALMISFCSTRANIYVLVFTKLIWLHKLHIRELPPPHPSKNYHMLGSYLQTYL